MPMTSTAHSALAAQTARIQALEAELAAALQLIVSCDRALRGEYPWVVFSRYSKKEAREAAVCLIAAFHEKWGKKK